MIHPITVIQISTTGQLNKFTFLYQLIYFINSCIWRKCNFIYIQINKKSWAHLAVPNLCAPRTWSTNDGNLMRISCVTNTTPKSSSERPANLWTQDRVHHPVYWIHRISSIPPWVLSSRSHSTKQSSKSRPLIRLCICIWDQFYGRELGGGAESTTDISIIISQQYIYLQSFSDNSITYKMWIDLKLREVTTGKASGHGHLTELSTIRTAVVCILSRWEMFSVSPSNVFNLN